MECLGVINKQTEPTDWVNSMVTVTKPNEIRICIDPQDLNTAIKREHHPLRTIEEVAAKMPNAKLFSALDANHGFWQIQLDEESIHSVHSIHHLADINLKDFHLVYRQHLKCFRGA